ncbi:hypothetical protein TeGR_g13466 [Tetraparma gracilis]|uniref:Autophagy-related protein 101 n=1 Tax=Tetraparma gracilis TaxID=2962635 RepID=A0ABQ6N164_9STRA|nr:hypothetical protein TeGR_g13466 [Tetraparma gracilis]
MNTLTHTLPESELPLFLARESLSLLLHSLLFLRAPGPVLPSSVACPNLALSYSKIGRVEDVDRQVAGAIDSFLGALTPIGPELSKGVLSLSFFERRVSKAFLGLVSTEERVVWEAWSLPLLVNSTPRPVNEDGASVIERSRIQESTEATLRASLLHIHACASSISHVPPGEERENVYARVAQMPALINLTH